MKGRCKLCGDRIYYNRTLCGKCEIHKDDCNSNKLICVLLGVLFAVWVAAHFFGF